MRTSIVSVDVRDDKSVLVYYSTGTTRPYKSLDTVPATVKAWLQEHETPERVTVTATAAGVRIQTAPITDSEPVTDQISTEEPMEPTKTSEKDAEAQEPIKYPIIPLNVGIEPITGHTEEIMVLPPEEPVKVHVSPGAVLTLAGLSIAYNSLQLLALTAHTAAIASEITEATVEVVQDIGTDTGRAIHRTGHCLRHTAGRITQAATRATRRAGNATRNAWGIISTQAVQTVTSVAIWAREAWAWREELVTAETVIG